MNWPTEDTRATMENSSSNMNGQSEELILLVELDNDYPWFQMQVAICFLTLFPKLEQNGKTSPRMFPK